MPLLGVIAAYAFTEDACPSQLKRLLQHFAIAGDESDEQCRILPRTRPMRGFRISSHKNRVRGEVEGFQISATN